jgi:hypothetical protein
VADEIRGANTVRLWRDPLTKRWFGLLGPGDGRGLIVEESNGCGPEGVLIDVARAAARGGWPFDPTAPGPVIDSGVKV